MCARSECISIGVLCVLMDFKIRFESWRIRIIVKDGTFITKEIINDKLLIIIVYFI
jgi:hypothetical protein